MIPKISPDTLETLVFAVEYSEMLDDESKE
jgi:hypothetical protein